MNSVILEKIKKLLRLAGSSNQHEAELALLKAQELAIEANIDFAAARMAADSENTEEEMIKESVAEGKRKCIAQKLVSAILLKYFNVYVVYGGNRQNGMFIHYIGKKNDVSLAIEINSFLCQEFMQRWRQYKLIKGVSLDLRNTFLFGMWEGLSGKLQRQKDSIEAARLQDEALKNKYALVLIDEDKQRKDKAKEIFTDFRDNKNTVKPPKNEQIRQDGRIEGEKIHIGKSLDRSKDYLTV